METTDFNPARQVKVRYRGCLYVAGKSTLQTAPTGELITLYVVNEENVVFLSDGIRQARKSEILIEDPATVQ